MIISDAENEATPLIPMVSKSTGENFYFLPKNGTRSFKQEASSSPEEVEITPKGSTTGEFDTRKVVLDQSSRNSTNILTKKSPGGILGSMIGSRQNSSQAVITIDPKIFFANERTFLAWLHTSVLLAGASIAINSFSHADRLSQLYGVALLPISVAFMLYSMSQYAKRAQMIRLKSPGPYEDFNGPTVLGVALMISIVVQFALRLYSTT